jgi:hypothetical protein
MINDRIHLEKEEINMNTISTFDKQIILCCKGWFDKITDKSRYDQLKWMISKECGVDEKIYHKDLGFITFLFDIIKSFNINHIRLLYSIWEDLNSKTFWLNKEPYDSDDYIKSLMKIIEFTKASEIPYELGEPDYSYFENMI